MSGVSESVGMPAGDASLTTVSSAPRLWGVWASLTFYLLNFEGVRRVQDALLAGTGLQQVSDHNKLVHVLVILAYWGINLALIVAAVRLAHIPVADYLAWKRPPARDIAFAIVFIALYYVAFAFLLAGIGAAGPSVAAYRADITAGTSPAWYVLSYWPAILLAPFVEESFFRGFLWRGVEHRLGRWAAFLVTTLLFAAMHYEYWTPNGEIDPGVLIVQYLIPSSIFGAVRWRSGSTVTTIFAHALDNTSLRALPIVLAAFY
jgi:membrane protease YdiL (CAAX protease family)